VGTSSSSQLSQSSFCSPKARYQQRVARSPVGRDTLPLSLPIVSWLSSLLPRVLPPNADLRPCSCQSRSQDSLLAGRTSTSPCSKKERAHSTIRKVRWGLSAHARFFIGGLIEHISAVTALTNPMVNGWFWYGSAELNQSIKLAFLSINSFSFITSSCLPSTSTITDSCPDMMSSLVSVN